MPRPYTEEQAKHFDALCDKVEQVTGVSRALFLSHSRTRDLILIRQAIMVSLRLEGWTLRHIMEATNRKDHATVIHMITTYNRTTTLMASRGDEDCKKAVDLAGFLRKFIGLGANQSKYVKIQIAKEMTANKSSLAAIVGMCA